MKTINIDFSTDNLGTIAREGELNRTQLVFTLDEDFQMCDFINVEFGFGCECGDASVFIMEHLLPDTKTNTLSVKLNRDITVSGMVTIQLVGYVVDGETEEPHMIAKSPVTNGIVTPSIKGSKKVSEDSADFLERILAKVHSAINQKLALKIETTIYNGSVNADYITVFTEPMTRLGITSVYNPSNIPMPEYVFIFTSTRN